MSRGVSYHLAVVLIVVRADELTDILPDFAGRSPSRRRIRRVPHHALITASVQISYTTKNLY